MLSNNRGLFTRLFLLWLFVLGAISGIWQDDAVRPSTAADKMVMAQQPLSEQLLPSLLTKIGMLPIVSFYGYPTHVIANATFNRFYIVGFSGDTGLVQLHEYDATSLALLRTLPLDPNPNGTNRPIVQWAGATPDGQKIYYLTEERQVFVINLATWTQQPTIKLSSYLSYEKAVGADGLLYATYYDSIIGIDIQTGVVTKNISGIATISSFAVWGNDLYFITPTETEMTLHKYDISGESPIFVNSRAFADSANLYISQVTNNGDAIILGSDTAVFDVNAETLADGQLLDLLPTHIASWGISPDAKYAFNMDFDWSNYTRHLRKYDLTTGQVVASKPWTDTGSIPSVRAILLPNYYALLDNFEVYRHFNYNIAIPLVGYNSCPINPLVDKFDNPTSGWPSFMTDETTVGYVDGRYHIYHLHGSQWLALTRRDGSERKITFSVDIETVDNSVSGIIFGLKPHWTEFYSVEYYPEYKTAAFFHYTNATGWELIHYQRDDGFPNQGSFYIQLHPNPDPFTPSPPYPTEAYISVLGRTTFSISNVDLRGSIGLLGGTTNGRGTTWFDNYNLDRQSCEFMNWSSPSNINSSADVGDFHIEAVPANVAERPPLETFLTTEQRATLFATPEP